MNQSINLQNNVRMIEWISIKEVHEGRESVSEYDSWSDLGIKFFYIHTYVKYVYNSFS